MVEYLKQMSELVSDSTDSEKATQALSAIVTEIKGKEALIATDQKLSKVLEKLIESSGATCAVIKPIFSQFNACVLDLIYDQYGSHVLESLLKSVGQAELDSELSAIVSDFCDGLCVNICDIIGDRRATYVFRTALLVFGGFKIPSSEGDYIEQVRGLEFSGQSKFLSNFSSLIQAVTHLDDSEIEELAESPHSSVTFQTAIILSSKAADISESKDLLTGRIFKASKDGSIDRERLSKYLNDSSIKAKFLEVAASVSGNLVSQLVNDFVTPLDLFFDNKFASSFLQALIPSVEDATCAEILVNNIFTCKGMALCVIKGRNHGIAILQKLAELLANKFHEHQSALIKILLQASHTETNNVWMSLLGLHPEMFTESFMGYESPINESRITAQGCLFVSTILRFKESAIQPLLSFAKPLMDHIKSMQLDQSRFLNEVGPGRMLQSLISSSCSFPNSMKMKIVRNLMLNDSAPDRLEKLVNDRKVGSWLVTCAWDCCDVSTKKMLGEKLLEINGLRESNWKIWKHCSLATFSRRNDDWTRTESKKFKAQNLIKDIVGEYTPNQAKKSKTM